MTTVEIIAASGICVAVIVAILTLINNRKSIRYQERREAISKSRNFFIDLRFKFKNEKISYINQVVRKKFPVTDKAIENIMFNVSKRKVKKKIKQAYEKYKKPINVKKIKQAYEKYKNTVKRFSLVSIENDALQIYNFSEAEMKKWFGEDRKFRTGKDLLLHNLQTIIDLTK